MNKFYIYAKDAGTPPRIMTTQEVKLSEVEGSNPYTLVGFSTYDDAMTCLAVIEEPHAENKKLLKKCEHLQADKELAYKRIDEHVKALKLSNARVSKFEKHLEEMIGMLALVVVLRGTHTIKNQALVDIIRKTKTFLSTILPHDEIPF